MDVEVEVSRANLEVDFLEARETKKAPRKKGRKREKDIQLETNHDLESAYLEQPVADPDEFGPLAEGLKDLVDWIDEVDPVTAEVNRRPVLPAINENPTRDNQTESEKPITTPDDHPTVADLDGAELNEPENPLSDIVQDDELAVESGIETTDPPTTNTDEIKALAEIVDFLLSDEGMELRREARTAAYEVRKAAYELSVQETQPQIDSARARLAEIESTPKVNQEHQSDANLLTLAQFICQTAQRQVEESREVFQDAQAAYERASVRLRQAITLMELGRAPSFLVEKLESILQNAASEMLAAWADHDRAQIELQKEVDALKELEDDLQCSLQELQELKEKEKAEIETEIVRMERLLKERQEEIAAGSPEVILWKAVQAERSRREDAIVTKLIAQLPSQGIRKTLTEASQLDVAQHPRLLQAIQERQQHVNRVIDACRDQAERMAVFPEVLPEKAYALLVRGDAIRIVDVTGHELSVMYAGEDGQEFQTVRSRGLRRWKIDTQHDCWLVKR